MSRTLRILVKASQPSADSLDKGDLPPMTDEEMQAIAQHCGFTARTLLRTFKRFTGMTPLQYAER